MESQWRDYALSLEEAIEDLAGKLAAGQVPQAIREVNEIREQINESKRSNERSGKGFEFGGGVSSGESDR